MKVTSSSLFGPFWIISALLPCFFFLPTAILFHTNNCSSLIYLYTHFSLATYCLRASLHNLVLPKVPSHVISGFCFEDQKTTSHACPSVAASCL